MSASSLPPHASPELVVAAFPDLDQRRSGHRAQFVHAGFGRTADISDSRFGWRCGLDRLAESAPARH